MCINILCRLASFDNGKDLWRVTKEKYRYFCKQPPSFGEISHRAVGCKVTLLWTHLYLIAVNLLNTLEFGSRLILVVRFQDSGSLPGKRVFNLRWAVLLTSRS